MRTIAQPRQPIDRVVALFGMIRDMLSITARAHVAAQLYDDLRRRCDIDLAERGSIVPNCRALSSIC